MTTVTVFRLTRMPLMRLQLLYRNMAAEPGSWYDVAAAPRLSREALVSAIWDMKAPEYR